MGQTMEIVASLDTQAADAAFDTARGLVYLSCKQEKKIIAIDLRTGGVSAEIPTTYMPERMAVTPNGKWLYAGLLVREHSYDWQGDMGYVAEIDLEARRKTREIDLKLDPFDLVATDYGMLVVSCGSGQGSGLATYFLETGEQAVCLYFGERARIALHPSQRVIYCMPLGVTPQSLNHFDLNPATGMLDWGLPLRRRDHPAIGEDVFMHPGGHLLFTGLGGVFTSSSDFENDMLFVTKLSIPKIKDIAFDIPNKALFCAYGNKVYLVNDKTLLSPRSYTVPNGAAEVGLFGEWVYVASLQSTRAVISRFPNPALQGAANTPPRARFVWSPTSPAAPATVSFDAGASTDREDELSELRFRWDWDSDGDFDTSFSASPTKTHRFATPGTKLVTLQVMDSLGLACEAVKEIHIRPAAIECQPTELCNYFVLPYPVSDALFDRSEPLLFVINEERGLFQIVDLETGLARRTYWLSGRPRCLAQSSDGRFLYIGLAVGETAGKVVEFDLEYNVLNRWFPLEDAPFDMAVSPLGYLVVSSSKTESLKCYRIDTGMRVGNMETEYQCSFELHEPQNALYGVRCSKSSTNKIVIDPETGQLFPDTGGFQFSGVRASDIFLDHSGPYLITDHGGVVRCSSDPEEDGQVLAVLEGDVINDVAFDRPRDSFFVVREEELAYYAGNTFLLNKTYRVPPSGKFVGLAGEWVYVLSVTESFTKILRVKNPAVGSETNTAPQADFSWTPAAPDTSQEITFDAGLSSDREQPLSELLFRWDLDGDGSYDTDFTPDPLLVHRYEFPGTKVVTLQVKDPFGLMSTATKVVLVSAGPVSDPKVPHPAFKVPFEAADAVFDSTRGTVYLLDRGRSRLVALDLQTGFIANETELQFKPLLLAQPPSGSTLYVATDQAERNQPSGGVEPDPHVIEIDPDSLSVRKAFAIDLRPWSIAATDDGYVLVASNGLHEGELACFRASTGEKLSSVEISDGAIIGLHPSQDFVIVRSLHSFFRFRLDRETGGFTRIRQSSRSDGSLLTHKVFVDPHGKYCMDYSGYVFQLSDVSREDFTRAKERSIRSGVFSVAFDPLRNVFFGVREGTLSCCNYTTLMMFRSYDVLEVARFVGVHGTWVYVLSVADGHTLGTKLENPSLLSPENDPPVPSFKWRPEQPDTQSAISFDASDTTDPQDPLSALRFRWDWEDNGQYDTDWLSEPVANHKFEYPGTKMVRLQVMDSLGLVEDLVLPVNVSLAGEVDYTKPEPAFTLPGKVTDVLFDPAQPLCYLSVYRPPCIILLNTETSFFEDRLELDYHPLCLALPPSGGNLYAAMVDDTHNGYVAEIDRESWTVVRRFPVNISPKDMVVTDGGILVVSGCSLEEGGFLTIRLADLEKHASDFRPRCSAMTLEPSQRVIFAVTKDIYRKILKLEIQQSQGSISLADSVEPSISQPSQNLGDFITIDPVGGRLFSGNVAYSYSKAPEAELTFLKRLEGHGWADGAFDPKYNALFTVDLTSVYYYNGTTLDLAEVFTLPLRHTPDYAFVGVSGTWVYAITGTYSSTKAFRFRNPAIGSAANLPPTAKFTWTPARVDTMTTVHFDASLSSDDHTPPERLKFRWDWDSDGIFDTEFKHNPKAQWCFYVTGPHKVTLEVMDQYGLRSTLQQEFEVALGADPGEPGEPHTPFEFPFGVKHAMLGPEGCYLYATSEDAKRLVKVNLKAGIIVRQFRFDEAPGKLAVTPSGKWLYVAIPECAGRNCRCKYRGAVAELDLTSGVMTRIFPLDFSVSDIVATDDRYIIVSGSSDMHKNVGVHDADSLVLKDALELYGESVRLALHPQGERVYLKSSDKLRQFRLDPQTGELQYEGSISVPGWTLSIDSSGSYLFTSDAVVAVKDDPENPLEVVKRWDESKCGFALASSGLLFAIHCREKEVEVYDIESFESVAKLPVSRYQILWLGAVGTRLYVLTSIHRRSYLEVLPLTAFMRESFVRGDPNQDGLITVSDPVFLLYFLYGVGNVNLTCLDAGDANDDGRLDLGDSLYLLQFLFSRGPEIPPPFGKPPLACGPDPTQDELNCGEFSPCK